MADISPYSHLPLVPAQPIELQPLFLLSLTAALLTVAGLGLWRRRDLT